MSSDKQVPSSSLGSSTEVAAGVGMILALRGVDGLVSFSLSLSLVGDVQPRCQSKSQNQALDPWLPADLSLPW